MRIAGLIGAALCALAAVPASGATMVNVGINGSVQGSQSIVMCSLSSEPGCLASYPSGSVTSSFGQSFDLRLGAMLLSEGDTSFSFGNPFSAAGQWTGTITNLGGVLSGRDLRFSVADSSCRNGQVGCRTAFATAASFNVAGGVPEPGTWAMMLIGFLAIGSALRQPRRALLRPAA